MTSAGSTEHVEKADAFADLEIRDLVHALQKYGSAWCRCFVHAAGVFHGFQQYSHLLASQPFKRCSNADLDL